MQPARLSHSLNCYFKVLQVRAIAQVSIKKAHGGFGMCNYAGKPPELGKCMAIDVYSPQKQGSHAAHYFVPETSAIECAVSSFLIASANGRVVIGALTPLIGPWANAWLSSKTLIAYLPTSLVASALR